jgi:mono/diheme cytochrome c family protein
MTKLGKGTKRRTTRVILIVVALLAGFALLSCERLEEATGGSDREVPPSLEGAPVVAEGADRVAVVATEHESPGFDLYRANCAICHGSRGAGGVGPALAGNPNLPVTDYVVAQVLLGGGGMPPFAGRMTDGEIAAVVSFIRTSWGNDFGAIAPVQVGLQHGGLRPGMRLGGAAEALPSQADRQANLSTGERIYVRQGCSGCHGVDGAGGIGPALAGNANLEDDDRVIRQILGGGGGMPPFAEQLDDEEIAAVASHERTAWGNAFGRIDAERVAQQRSSAEGQP